MTNKGLMPMASYRLAQYSVQTPCYICNGGNNFDAELCRHCHAPMVLAHQANSQKVQPHLVAVIGSVAAGKTVYLGMLTDMLSKENSPLQLLARGAFSISLQQSVMSALARCEFPTKTPNEPDRWNWMHCQVVGMRRRRPIEMIMPDVAGEALLEEIDHPNTYPIIRAFLTKCSGVVLLVDSSEVEEGDQKQDYFTMKMVSYLCELNDDSKRGWPARPVAVVFTKADQCDVCFDDPADYAHKHIPGMWRHCKERLKRHAFFACGVAGASASRTGLGGRSRVPLRIEPRGVVEPFVWLVDQISR